MKTAALRRTDSCGSLDSHSHKYATLTPPCGPTLAPPTGRTQTPPSMNEAGYEYLCSRQVGPRISPPRNYSPLCHNLGPRSLSPRSPLSPTSHTPSPDLQPHCHTVGSHGHLSPSRDRPPPPAGRYDHCHEIQSVRKAKSVRSLNESGYSKLTRTESNGQTIARSESLV